MWENGSVKGRCKREKEKGVFSFPISGSKQTREVGNEFSHFAFSSHFHDSKHTCAKHIWIFPFCRILLQILFWSHLLATNYKVAGFISICCSVVHENLFMLSFLVIIHCYLLVHDDTFFLLLIVCLKPNFVYDWILYTVTIL